MAGKANVKNESWEHPEGSLSHSWQPTTERNEGRKLITLTHEIAGNSATIPQILTLKLCKPSDLWVHGHMFTGPIPRPLKGPMRPKGLMEPILHVPPRRSIHYVENHSLDGGEGGRPRLHLHPPVRLSHPRISTFLLALGCGTNGRRPFGTLGGKSVPRLPGARGYCWS